MGPGLDNTPDNYLVPIKILGHRRPRACSNGQLRYPDGPGAEKGRFGGWRRHGAAHGRTRTAAPIGQVPCAAGEAAVALVLLRTGRAVPRWGRCHEREPAGVGGALRPRSRPRVNRPGRRLLSSTDLELPNRPLQGPDTALSSRSQPSATARLPNATCRSPIRPRRERRHTLASGFRALRSTRNPTGARSTADAAAHPGIQGYGGVLAARRGPPYVGPVGAKWGRGLSAPAVVAG